MKTNHFTIKNKKILLWRVGGLNSVKQKHFGKDGHQPPVARGVWCFPYPYYEMFMVYHQWEGKLPKQYRREIGQDRPDTSFYDKMTDEEAEQYHKTRDELMKSKKREMRPKTFWYSGDFYSHISYQGNIDYERWWLWDDVLSWSKHANKTLISFQRFDNKLMKFGYTKDHLELFLPNY